MSELLALSTAAAPHTPNQIPNTTSMQAKLIKADFHGSILTGICLTEKDVSAQKLNVDSAPKQESVFGRFVRDCYI
jgi:hypothetical protein